jgi:nitrite reductase/ring-hydroxylating ferredoxin subunit
MQGVCKKPKGFHPPGTLSRKVANGHSRRQSAFTRGRSAPARLLCLRPAEAPSYRYEYYLAEAPGVFVVFHVNGEFLALLNRCPHEGAPLEKAACVARLTSPEPGVYERSRIGELLRCPWHGWEFDMRNGQSWFDPKRVKVRCYPVGVENGEELAKGAYVEAPMRRNLSGSR